ncbi:MAG: Crp/Fnr family transcriptional regulator [Vulcanimicrobiaceae bacterium]
MQNVTLPTNNRILDALPPAQFERMASILEPVELRLGDVIYEPGASIVQVLFPANGVVSLVTVLSDGSAVESGATGREGVVGLGTLFGDPLATERAIVQFAGTGYMATAASFGEAFEGLPFLRTILRRYLHAVVASLAQTIACNRLHGLKERCARWLLLSQDRTGKDQFETTHEFLAMLLGANRTSVTHVVKALQAAAAIEYTRKNVRILDRSKLESAACECYGIIRAQMERVYSVEATPAVSGAKR